MNFSLNSEPLRWHKPMTGKKFLMMSICVLSLVSISQSSFANLNHETPLFSNTGSKLSNNRLDITVKGKVSDENGETLIGVVVKIKGTPGGAVTDNNGNFTIRIPSNITNPVLVFSYIGYTTQEIPVNGRQTINVKLNTTTNDLDEIVVVGYNRVKKSDLTGAVASVNAAEIRSRPVTNALQAIQGKAAGVDITSNERPGQMGSILIRGSRSIAATNSPLYVVDGIPFAAGGIDAINPNDIENIDILKDASATAIYGSRGANGVVLVTTKKGKSGRLSLDYVGTTTIEQISDRTEMMNSGQYVEFRRDAYRRIGFINQYLTTPVKGEYPTVATQAEDNRIFAGDQYVLDNIAKGWQNGTWDGSLVPTTNWTDLVSKTGITTDHTLSASGGTEKIKAYGSFGYLNQQGTQLGQDYTRYSTKVSVDIHPVDWFSMGVNLTATYGFQNYGFSSSSATGPGNLYFAAKGMLPVAVPFDADGNRIDLPGGDINIQSPVGEENYNINLRKTLRTIGSVYAEVTLMKGLKYRVNFGPDYYNLYNGKWQDAKSINGGGGVPGSSNYAQLLQNNKFAYTLDHLIYYDKTIGKHNFGATLLHSSSTTRDESSGMAAKNVPYASQLWYQLNSVSALDSYSTNLAQSSLLSYMGRVNYSFDNKYLLTASVRWDGASQLAPGNKWDFFPSAAIAWRMDQEDFLKDIKWIDQLKLRLGVGSTGNAAIPFYSSVGSLQTLYYPYGSTVSAGYVSSDASLANPIPLPNQALGWEHTLQYNLGIDFNLIKGRIGGSLDIYRSKTTDLLLLKNISTINGYSTSYANVGATSNKGVDLTLNTINVKAKNFSWSSTLNLTISKDKITELANGNDPTNSRFIGERINTYYDYVKLGIWQNTPEDLAEMKLFNDKILSEASKFRPGNIKVKDLNGDYIIDANNDRQIVGHSAPDWTGGITNTFTYKNFDLSFFILGRFNYTIETGAESLQGRFAQRVVNYWTPTNPTNDYPAPNYNSAAGDAYKSSMNYQDGTFIKIRNISLGYTFPELFTKKLKLSRVKVYVQATNPGLIYSKIDWIDPDLGGSTFNRGCVIGLNVGF